MKPIGLVLIMFSGILLGNQNRLTDGPYSTRSEVIAVHGMAATSQPLATDAAIEILKMGGSAVDAAIAANAVLGLTEPTGCGIGGDLFAIVWDAKTKKLYGLNASGRSPKSLTLDWFKDSGYEKIPSHGPLPVSVPGCVDGWFELHEKFGSLTIKNVLAPAIRHAEEGFPLTEVIAYYWGRSIRTLKDFPGFSDTFMPNGHAPKKGEIFTNPRLANTYRILAEKGRDAFYIGEIAEGIVSYIKDQGGFLSMEDLKTHVSEWIEPVSAAYRGYEVWELPPNGQGIAALQILNMLEPYNIASMGFGSADYIHLFTEAKKLAYEDRAVYYADMEFTTVPVDKLISKEYADKRRKHIRMDSASNAFEPGILKEGDTIYLTTADKDGNMVSLIQSNYRGMGSGMTPGDFGFILQDRGELFSLEDGHANVYAPGKRPFHTIIPAFVTKDGVPFMSFGVMGGAMQPQGHVQILVNLIDFGMNLQEAGDAPRVRHSGSSQPTGETMKDGGVLNLEFGFSEEVIQELEKRGHKVKVGKGGYGGYQAIKWDVENKVYVGASESRMDGHAAGY